MPTGTVTPNYEARGRHVVFKAQNEGPVRIRVQSCGLARTKRGWRRRVVTGREQLLIPNNIRFPQDVAPGDSLEALAEIHMFCGDAKPGDWADLTRAYFTDAIGRTYLGKLAPDFTAELVSISTTRSRASEEFVEQSDGR